MNLLTLNNISVIYNKENRYGKKQPGVWAVNNVSINIKKGEIFALVGETGCGKTSLALAALKFINTINGDVIYRDEIINKNSQRQLRFYRRQVQMVYQNAVGAFNPKLKVGKSIRHALEPGSEKKNTTAAVFEYLNQVGMDQRFYERYPHELSGGQAQCIGLARALAVQPEMIILDEPVSALDVSNRLKIIELLKRLKQKNNLTYLIISHDLSVVKSLAERVAVMRNGQILEVLPTLDFFNHMGCEDGRQLLLNNGY